eukprot:SAG31_NODE_1573_length_7850_cov_1.757193_5_plen_152_part_00
MGFLPRAFDRRRQRFAARIAFAFYQIRCSRGLVGSHFQNGPWPPRTSSRIQSVRGPPGARPPRGGAAAHLDGSNGRARRTGGEGVWNKVVWPTPAGRRAHVAWRTSVLKFTNNVQLLKAVPAARAVRSAPVRAWLGMGITTAVNLVRPYLG